VLCNDVDDVVSLYSDDGVLQCNSDAVLMRNDAMMVGCCYVYVASNVESVLLSKDDVRLCKDDGALLCNEPDNYMGITVLSCFGKLFTSVLNVRINAFLEENKLLGNEQAGFQYSKAKSCVRTSLGLSFFFVLNVALRQSEHLSPICFSACL
jgi:hypothetical protein